MRGGDLPPDPLDFGVLAVGNLTNAFAQSVSVGALAMMARRRCALQRRLVAAFTVIARRGVPVAHQHVRDPVVAGVRIAACSSGGAADPRSDRRRSPSALARRVAAALAVALYYAHFVETYRTELARIGSETAAAAPDAGGRGIATRLASVPRYWVSTSASRPAPRRRGRGVLWRRGAPRDRLTLASAAGRWRVLAFLVLGVLTPVDMRYYLAAIPALAAERARSERVRLVGGDARIAAAVCSRWTL